MVHIPEYSTLHVEKQDGVAVVTIDRPKALNALNDDALDELEVALQDLAESEDIGVVVVTGAGEKAFIAGADISIMADMNAAAAQAHARRGQRVVGLLESMPKPTIAAINGYALGGGLEVAVACDIRLASENAILGLPEVGLGVIPGFGGTQRLPRLIPAGVAKELVFTGRKIPAQEAERLGLVNRVIPRDKLLDEAKNLAKEILANGPVAVRLAKDVMTNGLETDLETGLSLEEKAFGLAFATADQKEGMKAFLEKRKPSFRGE